MDSSDTAYPAANHLQNHYDHRDQQHQMCSAAFSNTQFVDYNSSTTTTTTTTTTTDSRLTSASSTSSSSISGSSSPEEQRHQQQEITNSILTNHPTGHHISHQTNEKNTNTDLKCQEIDQQQVAETTTASEGEEANDEDSFVAFCTDASSVLNNDPTRRYYINKLYQPMNGQQEDSSSAWVDQDDEYLLYQELRNLESTAQELTDEVQLTKILEDDEGDDDPLLAIGSLDDEVSACQSQDNPLDRLQLTSTIEGFDSFPSSPLICRNGRDPLISEASEHHQQDKPDSTRHSGQISPSSNSSSCTNSGRITTNSISSNSYLASDQQHNHYQQHFSCNDQDDDQLQQFGLSNHGQDNHENHQNHHFLSMNSESHQHQHHHHHNQQPQYHNSHQMNKDDHSEISCFQSSVSPNFMSSTFVPAIIQQQGMFKSCVTQQQQPGHMDTAANNILQNTNIQSNKRSLQQADDGNDEASCDETNKSEFRKSRTKKKRNSPTTSSQTVDSSSKSINSTSSSKTMMLNEFKQTSSINSSSTHTNMNTTNNEYQYQPANQHQHIITSQMDDHQNSDENLEDSNMSLDEDATSSAGGSGRRHSSMSKYRRRTANARERIRMREINQAFEKLKKVVPIEMIQQSMSGDESDQTSVSSRRGAAKSSSSQQQQGASTDPQSVKKLTKITTLRLAVSYIANLSELLNSHPECGSQASGQRDIVANATEAANRGSNIQVIKGKPGTESKGNLTTRKRRGRADSTAKKQKDLPKGRPIKSATEIAQPKQQQSSLEPTTASASSAVQQQSLTESSSQQPTTILLNNQANNQGRHQPILIANNVINGQIRQHHTTAFLPIQQQTQHSSQPQFAYAQSNQQPLAVSQTGNNQDRSFVTPLAVAILGIQGSNEQTQTLQLVGIQNAQQHLHPQHQQQHQDPQLRQQQHQAANGQYNLITTTNHQPQQVTLTLDDINGLSVLRLANPHSAIGHGQQQTIQLQQNGRPTIVHQPQTILATQNGSNRSSMACQQQQQLQQQQFNYATYQPIQISQVQQAPGRQMNGQQQMASIQLQEIGGGQVQNGLLQRSNNGFNEQQSTTFRANQLNDSTTSQIATAQPLTTTTIASTPTTTTGITSDCRSFGISPNMIAQHLNNNGNNNNGNVVQTTQIKIQQSNCSGQIVQNGQLVAMPAGAQLFRAPSGSSPSTVSGQTNLIYINPPISLQGNTINHHHQSQQLHQQQQMQQVQIQRAPMQMQQQQAQQIQLQCTTNHVSNTSQLPSPQHQYQQQKQEGGIRFETSNGSQPSFERMKFVTQFSSQNGVQRQDSSSKSNSEANIRQLVATLATSIHPKGDSKQGKANNPPDQSAGDNQQRQQPKKTYRFHNYDGNMITNHLYNNTSNNGDKQQQQQQAKKCQQQQPQQPQTEQVSNNTATSQRSRQNSLSSTCSTTSSSSSLASLSSASPLVGSIMIKSPPLESSNSSGSLSAYPSNSAATTQSANETTPESPVAVIMDRSLELGRVNTTL